MVILYSVRERKSSLRKKLRQECDSLTREERGRRSEKIKVRLLEHPRFQRAAALLVYVALQTEVETESILQEALRRGKAVYVPRVDPKAHKMEAVQIRGVGELKPGSFGIPEPPPGVALEDPAQLELVICPGLGFDREGGRLGRGEGYFDPFLAEATRAYKIGLAFECQMVDEVPCEANDVKMDEILIG